MADKETARFNLQAALQAYEQSPNRSRNDGRDTPQFANLNNAIRDGLVALEEDALDTETLRARGLLMTPYGEPLPSTYIDGINELINDLDA